MDTSSSLLVKTSFHYSCIKHSQKEQEIIIITTTTTTEKMQHIFNGNKTWLENE